MEPDPLPGHVAPAYWSAYRNGRLQARIRDARSRLECCDLCPRVCAVNRLKDETGICQTGFLARVSGYGPHYGEEIPLVGTGGSGTIFFTYCSLGCLFCQNYDISHDGPGQPVTDEQFAAIMMNLQSQGCHNINLVTPSHVVPQILAALEKAIEAGLRIPLVYNTSAYDSVETLTLLDGIVDIYMPDFKFWSPRVAEETCNAPDYPERARHAIREMHRQVGDLVMDRDGLAYRGILLRHLVLPEGMAGTPEIMAFIASSVSQNTYINIMGQYRPCGRANDIDDLRGHPSKQDMDKAVKAAKDNGLYRLDKPRRMFVMV